MHACSSRLQTPTYYDIWQIKSGKYNSDIYGFLLPIFFAATGLNIVSSFLKLCLQLAHIAAAERIRMVGELRKRENNFS